MHPTFFQPYSLNIILPLQTQNNNNKLKQFLSCDIFILVIWYEEKNSGQYAASLYVTKSVLQDMKDSKNNTPLYGFDSWGVPLFEDKFVYDFGSQSW